jgi:hypothetical protein
MKILPGLIGIAFVIWWTVHYPIAFGDALLFKGRDSFDFAMSVLTWIYCVVSFALFVVAIFIPTP